jgi:hypothetical protein
MSSSTARLSLFVLCALVLTFCAGTLTAHATTVTSVHYQKQIFLSDCTGTFCGGAFPVPGTSHRLEITRVNCFLAASAGSTLLYGQIQLTNSNNTVALAQFLPIDYTSPDGQARTLNQAVDVLVGPTQHLNVSFNFATGTVVQGICTASGTLDTLQ